jgi:ferredoxin
VLDFSRERHRLHRLRRPHARHLSTLFTFLTSENSNRITTLNNKQAGPSPPSASNSSGPPPMRGDVVDFYELLGVRSFCFSFSLEKTRQKKVSFLSRRLRPTWKEKKLTLHSSSPLSLQVDDDASPEAIKAAYRLLAKTCHPDVHSEGHALCILLNEAYETLSSLEARRSYNAKLQAALDAADDDYTGKPLSKWLADHRRGKAMPGETRAVFVDELSCIGCKNCIFEAAATFRVEREHGRARVFAQWIDEEAKIQRSIDSCPVSCIHWVEKEDLPALEHVTQKVLTGKRFWKFL